MSNFNWRNGFAFGLIVGGFSAIFAIVWLIGLNYCPNQPCDAHHQEQHDPQQYPSDSEWNMPNPFRSAFDSNVEPEYAEGDPKRHEYQDLKAQQRMAHATDWIFLVSIVTGLFSVAGVGLLVWTLTQTRQTNKIMRDEQRPWVKIYDPKREFRPIEGGGTLETFHLEFENIGKSPARDMRIVCQEIGPNTKPHSMDWKDWGLQFLDRNTVTKIRNEAREVLLHGTKGGRRIVVERSPNAPIEVGLIAVAVYYKGVSEKDDYATFSIFEGIEKNVAIGATFIPCRGFPGGQIVR